MNATLHKRSLISMITDDLINWLLVNELQKSRPKSFRYESHNIKAVIEYLGFEYPKMFDAYEYYLARRKEVFHFHLSEPNREPFTKLAEEIYTELERRAQHGK